MKGIEIAIALCSGVALAVQVGANSSLRARMGSPLLAALTSFGIGTVVLLVFLAVAWPSRPDGRSLREAPWWAWTGGVLGAVYVACAATFAPRLGAAGWLGLIVTGQILASLALDHYGLVGFPLHPINPWRILGAVLLLAGVTLVLRN